MLRQLLEFYVRPRLHIYLHILSSCMIVNSQLLLRWLLGTIWKVYKLWFKWHSKFHFYFSSVVEDFERQTLFSRPAFEWSILWAYNWYDWLEATVASVIPYVALVMGIFFCSAKTGSFSEGNDVCIEAHNLNNVLPSRIFNVKLIILLIPQWLFGVQI